MTTSLSPVLSPVLTPEVIVKKNARGVRTLLDIADVIIVELVALGIAPAAAREMALRAADRVRETYGGDAIYIPRGAALILAQRNIEIYNKFTGNNHRALGQEYTLTPRQIYDIIKDVRAADFAQRQMGLFDD